MDEISKKQKEFNLAIKQNDIKTVEKLLAYRPNKFNKIFFKAEKVDPSLDNHWAVKFSENNNNVEVLNLLYNDERILKHTLYNYYFNIFQSEGNLHGMIFLLNSNNFVPMIGNYLQALNFACEKGYLDVVKFIIKKKEVDITFGSNSFIYIACINKHMDIVHLLWKQNKIKETLKKDKPELYNLLVSIKMKQKIKDF
jgi:hypothetical protein